MADPADIEDRKAALQEYLDIAEDPAAARDFIADCLDPESDSELLTWLNATLQKTEN